MSKTKRLLSVTLAIAMIILSAFSAFAEDTETVVKPLSGTVAAGNVTVKPDVTEVTVPVTITFDNKQTSPHGMFDISADDATLKSATLKSFDNDNADPDAPDEKVIYIDTKGVNAEKGRVIVEAATDDLKKPLTSKVEIDVVLKFDTALTAGQVIDVVISNIAATNLSEASWDGMVDVDGTITVKAAEPECDHSNAVTKYDATQHWTECDCGNVSEKVDHGFTSEVAVAATETSSGIMRYTCECGYSYDDVIATTGSGNGGLFNITYTSSSTGEEISGNLVSLRKNEYDFTYDITDTAFLAKAKELGSANSTFGFVAVIGGQPYFFSKQTAIKNQLNIGDLSFGQFDSEIQIFLRLVYTENGEEMYYDSLAFWVNPYQELKEKYYAGLITNENEIAVVEAYINYSKIHAATETFETYAATSTTDVGSGNGGSFNITYTSSSTGEEISGNLVSLRKNEYDFTYDITDTAFLAKAKELGSANSTFGFVAIIGGQPYFFSKQTAIKNQLNLGDLSFGQFDSEIQIFLRLVYTENGEEKYYDSDSFTVNPHSALSTRTDNDSALKTAYLDYKEAWAVAYN